MYKLVSPIDTRRRFNVYTTSPRRLIDVETTKCINLPDTIRYDSQITTNLTIKDINITSLEKIPIPKNHATPTLPTRNIP